MCASIDGHRRLSYDIRLSSASHLATASVKSPLRRHSNILDYRKVGGPQDAQGQLHCVQQRRIRATGRSKTSHICSASKQAPPIVSSSNVRRRCTKKSHSPSHPSPPSLPQPPSALSHSAQETPCERRRPIVSGRPSRHGAMRDLKQLPCRAIGSVDGAASTGAGRSKTHAPLCAPRIG